MSYLENAAFIIFLAFVFLLLFSFYIIKRRSDKDREKRLLELDNIAKRLIKRDMELSKTREEEEQRIKELDRIAKMLVRRDLELTLANEKLRELDRTKSEFISIAAHQLRSPLGGMRWNIEMLLSQKEITKDIKERIKHIYDRSKYMIRMVNDLITVSRIEQGRVKESLKLTVLSEIVRNVIAETKDWAWEKGVTIELKENKDKIPDTMIDPEHFREVVQNLLANAVKYNKANGKVTVEWRVVNNEYIQLNITDTGIGIPQKDKPRIFSKFFRAANAIKSDTDGSGLGLFVVKYYVEGWKGKVGFQSEEGKGTTFYIALPLDKI